MTNDRYDAMELNTERLLLRQWKQEDFAPFAELNSDSDVMEYFPSTLSPEQSDDLARLAQKLIAERGWGIWAIELITTGDFIGFVGLHYPDDDLPFTPCVEIAWRLRKQFWGKGYATEAAKESLSFAFSTLQLDEVFAYTAVTNVRSRSVMERLGLHNTDQNFEHPNLPKGHPLSEHVVYKLSKQTWSAA